jgi:excisionase family DNA binding protein
MRRKSRSPARRIVDPVTHPDRVVCLEVAAEFLGLDARTVRSRIESGELVALVDGKVYRIELGDLLAYDRCRRMAS